MQFSNYDFIDSKSFAGKIILTSFPGLNSNGLFEEKILANELDIFKNRFGHCTYRKTYAARAFVARFVSGCTDSVSR